MDLKKIILIIILIGTVHTRSKNGTKRIRQLQKHVTGLERRLKKMEANQRKFVLKRPDFAHDCKELFDMGYMDDGIYTLLVDGNTHIKVWCDMTNGGWIVFMKRYNGEQLFGQKFQAYSQGFGKLTGEFWLGLNNLHLLTKTGNWKLRVDLRNLETKFRPSDIAHAEYSGFHVGAGTDFTLNFDENSYNGTAGDSLGSSHGMKFTTCDMDQSPIKNGRRRRSCDFTEYRSDGRGGWWYGSSTSGSVQLTGDPYRTTYDGQFTSRMWWANFTVYANQPITSATFKIRRN